MLCDRKELMTRHVPMACVWCVRRVGWVCVWVCVRRLMADRRPILTDGVAGRSVASRLVVACSAFYPRYRTVPYTVPSTSVRTREATLHSHDTPCRELIRDPRRTVHTYCLGTEGGVENRSHAVLSAECRRAESRSRVMTWSRRLVRARGAAGAVPLGDWLSCSVSPYQSPRRTKVRPPLRGVYGTGRHTV